MKLIDKILIGATGIGAVAMGVDYMKHRNEPRPSIYMCPYCKQPHEMNQEQFSFHIVDMRRQYG